MDYLTTPTIIWLIAAVVLLISELLSGTLYMLCLTLGAVGGAVASALGGDTIACVIVFSAVSLLTILTLRPLLQSKLTRKDAPKSNTEALIGRRGRVTETIIAHSYGRVAIDGDDWRAQSTTSNVDLPIGTLVTILSQDSVILNVEPYTPEAKSAPEQ